jgi:hypothetical protein
VPEPKRFTPIRIFLSYGHDANEELVRRIKADLEKRGHNVWFDKSEIKFGDDWRHAITDGIVGSNRVLSFLSKHSTRDPGVCLDEIAIAIGVKGGNIQTILVESETEVKPPASISYIQWLDMHDWKARRAGGEAAWEDWYQAKLAEIVRVVESEESRRFAGEIEKLNGYLRPISSDSRIAALLRKGFVGRTWVVVAIEQWRNAADCASRLFWIIGDPGVGKSAFAAHLTHFGRDKVITAQFVEWDKPDHRNAPRVVRSLAFQLATRLPDYRKLLLTLPEIAELDRKNPAELFDYLLANPLRSVIHGGRERYLIVIDALDEAGDAERNPLVEMLARHALLLPDWLGLVVTSRPESAVKTPLQGLNPFVLDTRTEANRADIRAYLRHELAPQLNDRPDADWFVEQILEKSEGVFLYIERVCHDLQQGHLSLDRLDQFPQGLGDIFCQFFDRQFPDLKKFRKDVRPALRAILAAREPLPVAILQTHFGWAHEELHDFLSDLGSLFQVAIEAGTTVIKPYHKSLADWLADEVKSARYFVSIPEGHHLMAGEFVTWLQSRAYDAGRSAGESALRYWARWGLDHLALSHRQLPVDVSPFAFRQVVSNVSNSIPAFGEWTDHTAAFADEYLRSSLDCNNEAALLHLLRLMKEAAFIEYIAAGVLEKKESSRIQIGADFYGTTGTATDGVSIQRALTASAYAGSVARTIAASRHDMSSSLAKAIIKEIEILSYLADGFERVRWADHISGYFEDAGGFLSDELDTVLESLAAQAWPIPISEEVQTLLRDSKSRIKEPEVRLNESGTRRVWGQIISPSFEGKPQNERQSMVWDYLGLHPEVAQRVNYLETLTPQEASSN